MTVSFSARIKQLVKHGVVFGLTSSLQSALSFILLPIYAKYMSPQVFGEYSLLLYIAGICNSVFCLGASSALGRYYYDYEVNGQKREIVSAALFLSFVGSVVLVVLAYVFSGPICSGYLDNVNLKTPFLLCIIGNALTYPVTTLTLLLRYKKKPYSYLAVSVMGLIINFCVSIIIIKQSLQPILAPFVGLICGQSFQLIILFLLNIKDIVIKIPHNLINLIFVFGIQLSLSGFVSNLYGTADKFVTKELLSVIDVGSYSLGFRIGNLFHILICLPFALVWTPLRMEYRHNDDNKSFISKVTIYYTIVGVLFVILCATWGYDILKIFFPQQEYQISLQIFPIIMLGYIFYGYMDIFNFGVYISNKLFYLSVIPIICVPINILLNVVLIPVFGIKASAWIFVVTYAIASIILVLCSNKYYYIKYDWLRLILSIVFTVMSSLFVNHMHLRMPDNTILFNIIYTIVAIVFLWFIMLTSKERLFIINKIKHL